MAIVRTRVLIVDDSPTARLALRLALELDATIEVVGEAADAAQALRLAKFLRPDIVTMDVYLHHQNGLDVAAAIMEEAPCPILIVTAINPSDPGLVYRAVAVGALEVCGKLPGYDQPTYGRARSELADLVKSLARVPVVRRRAAPAHREGGPQAQEGASANAVEPARVVAIGASTGGPPVVSELLGRVSGQASASFLVAQHMATGFMRGFAEWLGGCCSLPIHVVERPVQAQPGHVYLAADDRHLTVASSQVVAPSDAPPRRHHRPSIDTLFEGVARHYGAAAVAVLLTGMGDDGAAGLLQVREAGGLTIVQEPETCAVSSMPERAIALGAPCEVLDPFGISQAVIRALARAPS